MAFGQTKKEKGQVVTSAQTSGDISLNQSKSKAENKNKESISKTEETRSLYSDADMNEIVDHAQDEEPFSLS